MTKLNLNTWFLSSSNYGLAGLSYCYCIVACLSVVWQSIEVILRYVLRRLIAKRVLLIVMINNDLSMCKDMDSNFKLFKSCFDSNWSEVALKVLDAIFSLLSFLSSQVVDSYGYGFESGYLVSNFDLIVVNVDARGTCCRGER